ncbi:MAG: hypothetical protein J1E78_07045 [Muribaculaceae bacterium]|nr:hypothetical protein [Muribaculaceae bacterium]
MKFFAAKGIKSILPRGFFVLTLMAVSVLSCRKFTPVTSDFVVFDQHGLIQDKDYILSLSDSILHAFENKPCTISLIVRFSSITPIKELPLKIEYPLFPEGTIKNLDIVVPFYNTIEKNDLNGKFGVFQKIIPIINHYKLEEGFFIAFKTLIADTKGVMDIGLMIEPE